MTKKVLIIGGGFAGMAAAYELVRFNHSQSNHRFEVTVVEKNPDAGGRIWTVTNGTNGHKVEMGGEFVDGQFQNTLRYCAQLGLTLECVEGWTESGKPPVIDYAGLYRVEDGLWCTGDTLPPEVRENLKLIDETLTAWGRQFITHCCAVSSQNPEPVALVSDTEQDETTLPWPNPPYVPSQLPPPSIPLVFIDQAVEKRYIKRLTIKPIDEWPDTMQGYSTWKQDTVKAWLDKKFPPNDPAMILARQIFENSFSGEYGDVAKVGMAFAIHQAGLYLFNAYSDLNGEQALALRECMRVVEGNQKIATKMAAEVAREPNCQMIYSDVVVRLELGGQGKWKANTQGGKQLDGFDHIVLTVPAFLYPTITVGGENVQALTTVMEQAQDINYGLHGKIAMEYNEAVASPAPFEASYWGGQGPNHDALRNAVASQLWIESPFLGNSNYLKENDWITFYLTHNTLDKVQANLASYAEVEEACSNWLNRHICTIKGENILKAGVAKDNPTRYAKGYAAYAPSNLPAWQLLIEANQVGLCNQTAFVAGEHTDDKYVGFMEGALRSGRKAAMAMIGIVQQ